MLVRLLLSLLSKLNLFWLCLNNSNTIFMQINMFYLRIGTLKKCGRLFLTVWGHPSRCHCLNGNTKMPLKALGCVCMGAGRVCQCVCGGRANMHCGCYQIACSYGKRLAKDAAKSQT